MSKNRTPLRLGSTAIAAVLALSSAPVFAQSIDTAVSAEPTEPTPVAIMPPAAPTTVLTVAPTNSTSVPATNAPATVAASTPAVTATPNGPIIEPTSVSSSTAGSNTSATITGAVKPAPAKHYRATSHSEASSTRMMTSEPASAPRAVGPVKAPGAEPAPTASTTTAPVPATTQSVAKSAPTQGLDDSMFALAGAGGLGVILLAGGAFALSRRKCHDQWADEEVGVVSETVEPEAEYAMAVQAPMVSIDPVSSMANKANTLPNGFDLSRFGPHMQAAYRGPTPENPSLSLKRRLKRAAFFDRQDRLAAESGMAPSTAAATGTIGAKATAPRHDEQIVYRPQKLSKGNGFRPAFRTSLA